jgi:4-amino-4-deoxy-L-arabinose transferase-like glycosyltransferase
MGDREDWARMRNAAWQSTARPWNYLRGAIRPFWRSPPNQPAWARPTLLAIAALAGLAYAWGMDGAALEDYYAAAARSMSTSWHDFLFGAFDPAGTISIDKVPGAVWPQALLLRIAGFHVWAIVLPQVIEGVVTVLVLYRAVRRLAGPLAGITAAAILAASPVTVALNRGNVADSLLIMLIVLAADATCAALLSGRLRTLLLGAVWVGLAFQAKMMVAWLVLPALGAAYLLAAPGRARVRLGHLALAGLVTIVVSSSWMVAISLVPAHERPYVDGTQNDSIFTQTFEYNGFSRLGGKDVYAGGGHPAAFLVRLSETDASPAHEVKPSWHRLLSGLFGRDDGWLLPAALIAAAGVLITRRAAGRRDPLRACTVLWGAWLLTFAAFFSAAGYPNSYYVAALTPATGALCGAGAALVQRAGNRLATRAGLTAAALCSVGYGIYLLHGATAVPAWLAPVAAILAVAGACALLARPGTRILRSPTRQVAVALACALPLPVVACVLMVTRGLGPFAAPYEPASATTSRASARRSRISAEQAIEQLSSTYGTPIALVTDSSILAAPFILATGQEVLPIGGYQGGAPAPSLTSLRHRIAAGEARAFLVPVVSEDPRVVWITTNCTPQGAQSARKRSATTELYDCDVPANLD